MEFLVHIRVGLPVDHDPEDARVLREAEAVRGAELYELGVLERIWRVPGRREAIGIWRAADATELHELLTSLPLFGWCDIDVVPLATHYVEEGARSRRPRTDAARAR